MLAALATAAALLHGHRKRRLLAHLSLHLTIDLLDLHGPAACLACT